MAHRFVQLPFVADCFGPLSFGQVTVAKNAVSVDVELATGRVTAKTVGFRRQEEREVSTILLLASPCTAREMSRAQPMS